MSSSCDFTCRLDHLVVCAADTRQGVNWFFERSGVRVPFGGKHPAMGTHNHLTALSGDTFLEIIAIDPDAPALPRKRWFALDDPNRQAVLLKTPVLATWVVATNNLESAIAAARDAGVDPGQPRSLTRGDLHWQLSVRDDGSLACDGVFPIIIQWPAGVNAVSRMQDSQLRMQSLSLTYPDPAWLYSALSCIGAAEFAAVSEGSPQVSARLARGKQIIEL